MPDAAAITAFVTDATSIVGAILTLYLGWKGVRYLLKFLR